MTTKTEITRALERVAKGDTLDADQPDFCQSVMLAGFSRFADQIAPDAPSTATALNGVAILRHKCALPESAYIEPLWIATRLVGVARGDAIVVDTLAAATMVAGAGGVAKRETARPAGYVLTLARLGDAVELAPHTRAAIVRDSDESPADDRILGGRRSATVTLNGAYCIDLYDPDAAGEPRQIEIARINKTAGQALDEIPARHDGVRRRPKGAGNAQWIEHTTPSPNDTDSVNDIYDGYTPEVALCTLAKAHPAPLVQSKTLAGARPVKPDYRPMLDPQVLISGAVSDCQFEAIVLAGAAHSRRLTFDDRLGGEPRMGFYIADGTGAGKSNTGIGIILDNWNQGRRRHLIIGEKSRHREGYAKAMRMLGMNPDLLMSLEDYRAGTPLPQRDGILFATYALLRQTDDKQRFPRVRQIVEWFGKGHDGILLMDESQNMRNGTMVAPTDGWSNAASHQAMAGIQLQDQILNARVVYSSATGSTLLENLSYMVRMGLWGPGTPYADGDAFYDGINPSGLSGLEAVSSHLKANGQMVCRQLSLQGVRYEELIHPMGPEDAQLYDAYCSLLFEATATAQYCAANALVRSPKTPGSMTWRNMKPEPDGSHYAATFASLSKRLIDTLIVSIKCKSLVSAMERVLAQGDACVIQIQNTFEAELNRMLASGTGIDTNQLQATSELIRFVASLPEHKMDYAGNRKLDRSREPIPVPENREAKNRLIERIRGLPAFIRPLEQIFGHFGTSRIAEITGRSNRVVPVDPIGLQGDPNGTLKIEERSANDVRADHRAFMNDQKQILIFSNDAGGTGYDYHASLDARNQRQRWHFVLQFGHRADQAVQGPGRSHRSYQRQPPIIVCVALDMPAEKINLSAVVNRMASLGALSQGHRQASANGMFSALDTYRSSHADTGWTVFATKVQSGQYSDLTQSDLAVIGSLEKVDRGGTKMLDMKTFLKRAAALPVDVQRRTFAHLDFEIQNHIMALISAGTYDSGPETMRDPITILSEEVIYTHPNTGARIKISRVECDVTASLRAYDSALMTARMVAPAGTDVRVLFNEATADIWVEYDMDVAANGYEMVGVIRPDNQGVAPRFTMRGRRIEEISDPDRIALLWGAAMDRIAKHRVRERTIVSGALPLIWTMLQQNQNLRRLIIARTVNDQRILGFNTHDAEIENIRICLNQMEMTSVGSTARAMDDLTAGLTINLGNGMLITPQLVGTSLRQTLNAPERHLQRLRQNASALDLTVIQTNGLEFFALSTDPKIQERSLRRLINVYGYRDTTDLPDWTRLR